MPVSIRGTGTVPSSRCRGHGSLTEEVQSLKFRLKGRRAVWEESWFESLKRLDFFLLPAVPSLGASLWAQFLVCGWSNNHRAED